MQYVSIAYKDRFVEVQPNEGDPLYLLGTSGHGFGAPTIFERTDLGNNKITLRLLPDESGQYWGDKPAGTHGYVTADPQPLPPFVGDYAAKSRPERNRRSPKSGCPTTPSDCKPTAARSSPPKATATVRHLPSAAANSAPGRSSLPPTAPRASP
jgi:hypothetical protein